MFGQCWCKKGGHLLRRPRHRLQLVQWLWHCSFPYMAGYCPECASLHSTQFSCLRASPSKVESPAESFCFKPKPSGSTHKANGFPFRFLVYIITCHVSPPFWVAAFAIQPLAFRRRVCRIRTFRSIQKSLGSAQARSSGCYL